MRPARTTLKPSGLDLDYVAVVQTNSSYLTAFGPILVGFTQVTVVIGDRNVRRGHAESGNHVLFVSSDLDARHFFGSRLLNNRLNRYRRGNWRWKGGRRFEGGGFALAS